MQVFTPPHDPPAVLPYQHGVSGGFHFDTVALGLCHSGQIRGEIGFRSAGQAEQGAGFVVELHADQLAGDIAVMRRIGWPVQRGRFTQQGAGEVH